jgi:adenosylcobinamide-phosphate synthase
MIDPLLQIWIALALDGCLGDPRRLPHPVRLIGRAALAMEGPARRLISGPRLAGLATTVLVVGGTATLTWTVLGMAQRVSPLAGDLLSILFLYSAFAARDLADHGLAVARPLAAGDLETARRKVARLVGRDTHTLDESGITRAAVESVAENTVDGILAPLFFAFFFGPVGAMAYKAASTLDSTFGYRNTRYLHFGWASARLDDAANYIPARLGLLCIALAAASAGDRPGDVLRIAWRDSGRHASPNAGLPEAAFAAALGVQLGGPVMRGGMMHPMPLMGDPGRPLAHQHIQDGVDLMIRAALVAALLCTAADIAWQAGAGR